MAFSEAGDESKARRIQAELTEIERLMDGESWEEAFRLSDRFVSKNPLIPVGHSMKAMALIGLGRHKEAITESEFIFRANGDPTEAWAIQSIAYERSGNLASALSAASSAVASPNGRSDALELRSRLLCLAGDFQLALRDIDEAILLFPTPARYVRRAIIRAALGDRGGASGDLEIADRLQPDEPWILREWSDMKRQTGDEDGAKELEQRATGIEARIEQKRRKEEEARKAQAAQKKSSWF